MRIAVFARYAILGSLMFGCTAETPPTDRPSPPSWHDQFAMPWEIDPAQVPMNDARVRDKLLRADRAARQLVGPDWPTRAGATYRLEERAREQVSSGLACEVWTLGGPTGAEPPNHASVDTIPEAIKQDVLRQALEEITQQKKTVADHYEVMHEVAVAAFPLLHEIVADSPQP